MTKLDSVLLAEAQSHKSLWEDMPIMKRGGMLDAAIQAMQLAGFAIDQIGEAIKSDNPCHSLLLAERELKCALDCVRAVRDVAQSIHPDSGQFGVGS